jgi:superfamily I DNA/RNA helicase
VSRAPEELETARRRREETSDRLLASSAARKLVVAGPGTGKTHNFRRVLEKAGGGLALTFIRALARDLESDLGDIAQVNTFHGYCKHVAHSLGGLGELSDRFDYYPALPDLLIEDLEVLGRVGLKREDLERPLRFMDDSESLITASLELGDYYDAVGHTDVVYRVQRHFEEHPADVPKHPVIVVDEYQDFNLLETRFITTLAEKNAVLIAGDDDQALYGFKDASAGFIRDLAERSDVDRFDLPYCSRCTEVIVNAVTASSMRRKPEVISPAESSVNTCATCRTKPKTAMSIRHSSTRPAQSKTTRTPTCAATSARRSVRSLRSTFEPRTKAATQRLWSLGGSTS